VEQKKQAHLPLVDVVQAFLTDRGAAIACEQRSPWITPWELAARLSLEAPNTEAIRAESVEAALRALSIPCVKAGGASRYLLAPTHSAEACLTPESLRPSEVAVDLQLSLWGAGR
jgi:hypothetical protein